MNIFDEGFEYRANLPSGQVAIAHGVVVYPGRREPYAVGLDGNELTLTEADKRWIDPTWASLYPDG